MCSVAASPQSEHTQRRLRIGRVWIGLQHTHFPAPEVQAPRTLTASRSETERWCLLRSSVASARRRAKGGPHLIPCGYRLSTYPWRSCCVTLAQAGCVWAGESAISRRALDTHAHNPTMRGCPRPFRAAQSVSLSETSTGPQLLVWTVLCGRRQGMSSFALAWSICCRLPRTAKILAER